MTGQSVTEMLNDEVVKIVSNDSRKNGVTAQVDKFLAGIRAEFAKGSPRPAVERALESHRAVADRQNGSARALKKGQTGGGCAMLVS